MPHITLETSTNLQLDHQAFFKQLAEQLIETGHAKPLGIKCRVVESDQYYIADGNPNYKMVNLLFRLREGRPKEVLIKFSEIGMSLMEKYFEDDIKSKTIILSTEIKELIKGQDLTKNAIR